MCPCNFNPDNDPDTKKVRQGDMYQSLILGVLFAARALGKEDANYDPATNYRPENVTGLDYYYYPWKGSYYNGSAIFTVSDVKFRPEFNYDDEKLCRQLENVTYSFQYPAILGILQTEGEDNQPDNTNPINVILSTSYSNFSEYFNDYMDSGNMQIKDEPWVFESTDVSRRSYGYEDGEPNFNLTVADGSGNGSPFRVMGTSGLDDNPLPPFQMNMSSCTDIESWWGASFVSQDSDDEGMGISNPVLQLVFDDHSANLEIQSWIWANTLGHADDDKTLPIVARVSVEFLGRADAARSDILNPGSPPTWTPTMGFMNNSLSLDCESTAASAGKGRMGLLLVVLGLSLGYAFL
ncbi:hypothetical protein FE257_010809 [Aspergillus nanangensis]|uniref:Uncharacterized protein n=1 Tax=Aspergillus nanangensis TaxID=2582783 RepID=A0AAD4CW11_ASPNN|nr:hypothetical protein FE257_010809 [Aspergillus nanangensis]